MNYIDSKELTPSNDNYLPLDTASYLRKFESSHVIFLLFSTQKYDTIFNNLRQKTSYIYIYIYIYNSVPICR